MQEAHDPKLIDALQRIFITRTEAQGIVDYQQRLFQSLQELTNSHRAVHEHVSKLTESHNRVQNDTVGLNRTRSELTQVLHTLEGSHRQTREDVRKAIEAINHTQAEVSKVSMLEAKIAQLEQVLARITQPAPSQNTYNPAAQPSVPGQTQNL